MAFHTHLTSSPSYIEGRSLEMQTAEVKSDGSDITWRVKMTGRSLSDGWEGFAVAHHLQIGNVIVVRYEGDMIFHVSDLGSSCCEIQDVQYDIGRSLLKKRLYPTTQVDFSSNDDDSIELPRKKNSPEAEEAVSSSSSDKSCFVAIVTASSLRTDKLYLPQHFTSSNGLSRNCRKIVIIDGGERSWLLDLRFDESSATFYISRRWRSFCDENGQGAGGFFMFKLVGNGETPMLSFCPEESIRNRIQRNRSGASGRKSVSTELSNKDKASKDENNKVERKAWVREKNNVRGRDSTPSSQKQFVTLTVTPFSVEKCLRSLPTKFTRENDINEPGMITLLGRDGTKQQTKLLVEKASGVMTLGNGWKDFVKANGLKVGNSFTFKLIWEDKTPVLSLCCDEFSKAVEKPSLFIDPCNKDENNKKKRRSVERKKKHRSWRVLTPSSQKEFVTLTVTPYSVEKCLRSLPLKFTRENDINKPGMITLLGKDGIKQQTKLHLNNKGIMFLGKGWKDFVKANGLKTGESFTLKLIWEGTTPVLSLCPGKSSIDRGGEGECSERNQEKSLPIDDSKEKSNIEEGSKKQNNVEETIKEERSLWQREYNLQRCINSTSPSQNRFLTITITPEILQDKRMRLPRKFVMENGMDKAGMVYLLGRDGKKWATNLAGEKDGRMSLGNGWVVFAEANEFKPGETFTLELIWEDETPMLRFLSTESSSTKANNQESMISTEDTEPRKRDSSPAIGNRSVTLTVENKKRPEIPSNDNDGHDDIGKSLLKKRLYPTTQVDFSSNDDDSIELPRKKKVKKNSPEAEAVSCFSSDKSCFVAIVTASNLRTDKLYLPQHFTNSNGLTRTCRKILVMDGGERSWVLDLRFDESPGTFYISRGWRSFCDENGQKAGSFFMFKLVGNGETPVLSFCPTETINDRRQRDCSEASERESLSTELRKDENKKLERRSWEREKNHLRDSTPLSPKHFVTLTIRPYSVKSCALRLPKKFTSENHINKPGMITLLGKDGKKQQANMLIEKSNGVMSLGKGWKDFVKANGFNTGDSFTLKLKWEGKTPVLSLCCEKSRSDEQSLFIDPSNKERGSPEREKNNPRRDSTPLRTKHFVTLTITPYSVQKCILRLPTTFTRENDINKPGMVTLLGKDGIEHQTKLLVDKAQGNMSLGNGWRDFAKANGLNTGDSFTLKLKWKGTTAVLSLCCEKSRSDRGKGEFSEVMEKPSPFIDPSNKEKRRSVETEKNHMRSPSNQKEFVTLTITPYSVEKCILRLPRKFTSANNIINLGVITLLGKDGIKQQTKLLSYNENREMFLGNGWKDFVKANGLNTGDSFTLKVIWEGTTPVLSLFPTECSSDRGGEGESSDTNQKKSLPIENNKEQNCKDETIKEERENNHQRCMDSTSASQSRFLTITITPDILQDKRMRLPRKFVLENNMIKPGMIYLLGKDGKKWAANLVRGSDGRMNLGNGWEVFAEANELKPGECFTLESIWEDETPMLRFVRTESNSLKANKKELISTEDAEPRKRDPSPAIENRSVTLTLTHEDVRACKLHLPNRFMRDNGINKLGKIIILGENKMELSAYLLSRDGTVALENGWDEFCEANGVKLGESFTLEFVNEQDKTTPVLRFCSR